MSDLSVSNNLEIGNYWSPEAVKKRTWQPPVFQYKPHPEKTTAEIAKEQKFEEVVSTVLADKNLVDKSRAIGIAKMVCKYCDKYGIDPVTIAKILGKETGGFKFEPAIMENRGSTYKGVMQVSEENIKKMYEGNTSFSHDKKRIDELKKKYPTAKSLYNAIQNDVTLGLEVGIITFKSLLTWKNGNAREAFKIYCGNDYSFPKGGRTSYDPIPEYK